MPELLPLLASATVGGIIGYSTNWVAIKMLFRPLEEKRIFGIRVPFTPGVIPKQRKALGTSIGTAVQQYLLTSEALQETIESEAFRQHILNFTAERVADLETSTATINDSLRKLSLNIDSDLLINIITNSLVDESFTEQLRSSITMILKPMSESLAATQLSIILSKINMTDFNRLQPSLAELLTTTLALSLEQLRESETNVGEILPSEIKAFIEGTLHFYTPSLLQWVAAQCEREDIQKLIQKYITELLAGSLLGSILGGILPPASLTKMLCEKIQGAVSRPEAQEFVESEFSKVLNTLYNRKLNGLLPATIDASMPQIADSISHMIINMISPLIKNVNTLHGTNTLAEATAKIGIDLPNTLANKGADALLNFLSNPIQLASSLNPIITKILNTPVAKFRNQLTTERLEQGATYFLVLLQQFIKHYGAQILEALHVKSMVEKQIDRLELLQVEEIVLSVMNNQLKAITRFGLLLGALLGLLMPYINLWVGKL